LQKNARLESTDHRHIKCEVVYARALISSFNCSRKPDSIVSLFPDAFLDGLDFMAGKMDAPHNGPDDQGDNHDDCLDHIRIDHTHCENRHRWCRG